MVNQTPAKNMNSFADLYAHFESVPEYQAEKLVVAFLAELNAAMKSKDLNNAELARRMDVSPAYVAKLFRGPSNPSVDTLAKLASAVNCTVHLHLANNAADVRWFEVFCENKPKKQVRTQGDFADLFLNLQPVYEGVGNDEKFALAA